MKRFKFSLSLLALTILAVIIHSILLSKNTTPDAGLEVFNTIGFGVLAIGAGLLLDLYFIITRTKKATIQKRRAFWQIIGALVIISVIYITYYLLST